MEALAELSRAQAVCNTMAMAFGVKATLVGRLRWWWL